MTRSARRRALLGASVALALAVSPWAAESVAAEPSAMLQPLPSYPADAGAPGSAQVAAVIGRNGDVLDVRIERSSGNPKLDDAALNAVRQARFRFPADVKGDRVKVVVPIVFQSR